MTQEQTTQSLEQTLERTDFGHFVNENKKLVLILSAFIVLGALGVSVFKYQSNQQTEKSLAELFQVSEKIDQILMPEPPVADDKNPPKEPEKLTVQNAQELLKIVDSMPVEIAKLSSAVPIVLNVLNQIEAANLDVETRPVIEKYIKYYSPKERIYLFLALKLAVIYENEGNQQGAIEVLEKTVQAGNKILEAKIYLDLGRLYLAKGETEKARANFEYITKNHENTDHSKLATLYLMEL